MPIGHSAGSMPDMGYALQGAATSMMPSANSVMAQQQAMVHHSSGLLVGAGGGKQIVGPIGPHYQKQLDQANLSRSMASQHYHTRLATTAARNANSSSHHSKDKGGDSPNNSAGTLLVIGDTPSQANFGRVSVSKWSALDIGGIGLVSLSRDLYRYSFLTALYLNHNNLAYLSPEIGKLQSLVILDLSGNKLTTLPPEIGFVTALQELWLFDNQITYLPNEIGQLYQLEFLGIEGNMFGDPLEALVHKEGTQAAIAYLRDTMPGEIICTSKYSCTHTDMDVFNSQTYASGERVDPTRRRHNRRLHNHVLQYPRRKVRNATDICIHPLVGPRMELSQGPAAPRHSKLQC